MAVLVVVIPLMAIIIPELISSVRTIGYRATICNALGLKRDPAPTSREAAYRLPSLPAPGPAYYHGAQAPFGPRVGQPPGQFASVPGDPTPPSPSSSFFDFISASREAPYDPFPLWYIALCMHLHVIRGVCGFRDRGGLVDPFLFVGWWRPERTWIDRFGRALGAGWMAVSLAYHGISFFIP